MTESVASPPEQTHPYSVQFILMLGSNVELLFEQPETRVPFGRSCVLVLKKLKELPKGLVSVSLDLEAFSSASEAERAGRLLAFSLMWLAAWRGITIGFSKWTGVSPFAIRDRTRSDGITVRAEGRAFWPLKPEVLANEVFRAFEKGQAPDESVLTSMQFYAAARLESSEVARFISLMTALEALAEQQEHGDVVTEALKDVAKQLETMPSLADPSMAALRSSLSSQIRGLKRESVRRAINRTVAAHIKDPGALKFVDESYGIRSKMLHEGMRAPDLGERTHRLEQVMRQIYSSLTGLKLAG